MFSRLKKNEGLGLKNLKGAVVILYQLVVFQSDLFDFTLQLHFLPPFSSPLIIKEGLKKRSATPSTNVSQMK